MASLQQIQQALINMNETLFEEMCGIYLSYEFPLHRSFNPQNHKTKQKTKKGTPDISYKLPNEGYLFAQITTQENIGKSLTTKLKNDIKECFNIEKTKIEIEKIKEIALCYNEQIKPSDEELINDFAKKEFNIVPHHFGLKRIAKDILFKYHFIGREYLKLEFGTGQIVSIKQFIKTYESGGQSLATPLNNHYLERNQDLPNLIDSIINNNIVIIHGVAGSGKSKLAIEGIEKFIEEETEYIDLALFPNGGDLIHDLISEIDNSRKYILFVDDVNRIEQFTSVLAHYRKATENSLKLVLTVRDYAYSEAKSKLLGLKYSDIHTERFSDDEIRDLVEAAPFNIKNSKFRFKISSIAKGNPRLAIMTAKLALEHQKIEALDNIFDLFDQYFTSFIYDNDILNEPINLKVLGLLSFFNNIEHEKGREIEKLSSNFNLDENKIVDSIEKLHTHDLILLNFGYAKIGEQNLATYFYYKVFIKDKLLSINNLLKYYFSTHSNRFSDSIKSIIEHFGVESLGTVKPLIKKYWQEQDLELRQRLSFLDIFRQIIPNDVLVFIESYIESLPSTTNPIFKIEENNDSDHSFIYEPNALRLLFSFYNDLNYLDDAFQLSFSLIKKKPDYFNKLIQNLKEKFGKSFNDEKSKFERQHKLIDYLIGMSKKEEGDLYKISLIAVSQSILSTFKLDTEGFKSEDVNEDLVDSIKRIREKLKRFLYENVENFSEPILEVLLDNTINNVAISRETHEFDLTVTTSLMAGCLNSSDFRHCLLVQEECWLMNKLGSSSNELESIKIQFSHSAYETFINLNRERLRGKVDFEFENSDEFDKLKTTDQKQFFHFRSTKEVDNFIEHLRLILNWDFLSKHSLYQLRQSIYIILEENNRQNRKIGFHLLCKLITFFNLRKETIVDASFFKIISDENEVLEKLWEYIVSNNLQPIWKLFVLDSIPAYRIEKVHYDRLINTISIQKNDWYSLKNFEKYSNVDSQVIEKIVKQITDLNEKGGDYKIWLDREFHQNLGENNQLELAKESYLQQYFMNKHFDHGGKALLSILEKDKKFLNVLLRSIVERQIKLKAIEHRELSIVWELEGAEEVIDNAILLMVEMNTNYTIGEDFINTFFYESHLRSVQVNTYLLNLIKKYYYRVDVVNIAFNVINYSKKDLFDKAFVTYLSINQSKDDFEQIDWFENQIIYPGGAKVSKIKISKWQYLLNLVEGHEKRLDLIEIKRFINSQIGHQENFAVIEESWNFLKETW
tara:strand:+ start:4882 stop:8613 length:3732 start_codon:yes stop_codon:yes gene_type:complete